MKNCIRYQIKVNGKVQGVWFRKYTQDKARSLNLKGYVKNLPDGKVYIEVESSKPEKLRQFTEWLPTGSPLSQVTKVEISSPKDCQGYPDFSIEK